MGRIKEKDTTNRAPSETGFSVRKDKEMAKKPPTKKGRPVADFPIEYEWQTNEWLKLFDKQIELLKGDIARARAEDRVVVYLSCPISSRGGGYKGTNVDIAKHTERRLLMDWGHRFWILNPAQYQLESKEGRGLMRRHARDLKLPGNILDRLPRPGGGDYMRMWTKTLVEDSNGNIGSDFDAFYFLGPSDVRHFFACGGAVTVPAGIEGYFARKFTMDPDFRGHYSPPKDKWEEVRKNFFRFYSVRASGGFSLGCHDEWNILRLLNEKRLRVTTNAKTPNGDVGELVAGFYDDRQVAPGAVVTEISPGYAL